MTLAEARALVQRLKPEARCRRRLGYAIEVPGPHHTVAQYGRGPTETAAWVDAAVRLQALSRDAPRPA